LETNKRIENILKALGLNNSSFAKGLQVSSTTIDGYIKGRKNARKELIISQPNFDVIKKMVEVYNINADYVLGVSSIMFKEDLGQKNEISDFKNNEILDYVLENRYEFHKSKKMDLVIEVFTNIEQRSKIELANKKLEEVVNLVEKIKGN
jgi:transcriptional regulator with XRE-family HTH domain